MAILSFKVQADIQKVKDLRSEIVKLEAAMKQMKGKMPSADVSDLEKKLASAKTELNSVTTEAAKAGATFGTGLKKRILESSEVVNAFSEKIATQKAKIWELSESVKKLNKSYKESLKKGDNTESDKIFKQLENNKMALDNAKGALNKLNKEKAMAQIQTKRLRDEYSLFKQDTKGVASETDNLADSFSKWAKGIVGVAALKEFVGQIVRVRGEFQEMETAISTLVGDDMANKLLPQIKELAKVSPLTMTDIVGAEKMMLGFNIEADKTIEYLKALSDVSMGNSQKFNSLTLAFSQMSAAGKLMGQDLNQMINAGFNPLQVISQKTGKSIAQLKEEMSKGAVSAEMVQQAFIDATSAGGKFYNMSQNAAKTINGQISMLEDAVDSMFNELGKASEGVIVKAIQGATGLIQNYETVGAILLSLVATYGAYRAAIIAAIAIEKIKYVSTIGLTTAEKAHYAWLVLVEKAQKVLNRTMLANPYVLATMAVIGLAAGMIKLLNTSSGVETSVGRVNRQLDELKSKQDELKQSTEKHLAVIQDEATTMKQKQDAYKELIRDFPQLTGKYDLQTLAAMNFTDATKAVNRELTNQDILLNKRQIRESRANLQKLNREKQWHDESGNEASSARVAGEIAKEKKVLQGLLKIQADYRKAQEEERKKEETQNKKYWEKKKQEAEAKLEALDVSKKGSEEWNKYQKEIQQAQAKIDEYNSSKTDKKQKDDNKEDAKRTANLLKIEEYKQSVIDATTQAQFEIRQAEINAMKDGTEKTIAQINLDYDKQIAENKKRKEDFVKQLADQKALEWEVANPDKAKKGEKFDKSTVTIANLTTQQRQILEFYEQIAKKERETAEANTYKDLLDKYQTYMQKRVEIQEKYDKEATSMKNIDGSYKAGFSSANEAILNKERNEALAAVDEEFAMREEQFELWANEVADQSLKALEQLLAQAKAQLQEMENAVEERESQSFTEDQIRNTRAAVSVLEKAVKNKKVSPGKRAQQDWKDLYKTLGQVADQFENIGAQVGGTAGKVISLAGTVATGVISMINGVKSVSGAAASSMSALEKASVILAIVGAAMQVVTKIASMFTANYDAYNKMKKEYEALISTWDTLIDRKTEYLEMSYGNEALRVEEQAVELINKQTNAYRELAKARLASGASIGSHSIGVRMKKNLSSAGREELKQAGFGFLLDDMNKLTSLSVKQLKDLQENATIFWASMDEDIRKYLEAIIEGEKKAEDIQKKLQEQLTSTTFESVYNNFLDMLSDMDADSEQFAENFEEYMFKAMLSSQIAQKYKDRLQQWYDSFARANQDELTSGEIEALRKEWESISQEARLTRDQLAAVTGYGDGTTSQKATAGGFETMTSEDSKELSGRFTALQMAGQEIKREAINQTITLNEIKGSLDAYMAANGGPGVKTSLDNILTFVSQSYMELQQINQNTAENVTELKKVVRQINKWDSKIMSL